MPTIITQGIARDTARSPVAFGLLILLLAALPGALSAQPPTPESPTSAAPTPEKLEFFEKKVRPVLTEHCLKCHGPEKQWSSFRVDSRAALLAGGDFGAAVTPGKPEESLLLTAIRQTDENLSMPPKGKLTPQQIADIEEWIRLGAPFPETAAATSKFRDPNHWAFQPIRAPAPLEGAAGRAAATEPTSFIDAFIDAELAARGMAPAPPADKRTLVRRATFDLTGLPPTPEEVAAFLADDRPDAFARLLDRLLASPAYGERWGRHWLDVARYADSNGLDENIAHGNAWRYRDYVTSAFNRDKPYDQFVREQIAGDLLPAADDAQRREHLTATGFLVLGPKVLAEVDELKMEMDIIDEQVDTVGKAFMGMTLGCARCHDHKFDPITTDDYYALASIFKSTQSMESFTKIAKWRENRLPDAEFDALEAAHQQAMAQKQAEIDQVVADAVAALKAADPQRALPEKVEELFPDEVKAQLAKLREQLAAHQAAAPAPPTAMGVADQKVVELPIHIRGNHLQLGEPTQRHVPVVFGGDAPAFSENQSGRRELADWLTDPDHPLTYRVLVNRVWRWHFGKGLVRSPDNFGMLGEPPTHPALLDRLTRRFIEEGYSVKALHRQIMLSAAYQRSSQAPLAAIEADPENRFWGRFEVRRLEAEAVRDALLAVSGLLDGQMGGSLLKVKNREFFFDHTSKDLTDYTSNRRSLYLPIVRNHVYDVFALLDYPDAAVTTGDRATTTIAPQALLMLNSDLVERASEALAQRLQIEAAARHQRIEQLYERCYGRPATAEEVAAGEHFLREAQQLLQSSSENADEAAALAWRSFCQSIVAANEFIYVR